MLKFYDRESELKRINGVLKKLKNHSSVIVMAGRRRIGKTRLVLEAHKNKPRLYFFVGKKKMPDLLREWTDEINATIGTVHGDFSTFGQMIEYLFEKSKENEFTVFFDEVQNFLSIEPSAFSDLQKYYDLKRETSSLLLVFAGSSHSMVEKIFIGSAEPLFGRASEFIRLSYLPVKTQKEILVDSGMYSGENLLHTFSIFDGIPRYYEEMVESREPDFKEAFRRLLTQKEFLWEEGLNIMREEFGKEYSIYHSILSAIALGKRTRNEIEQSIKGSAGGYLQNLENIYGMIKRMKPLLDRSSKSSNRRYYLADNFFDFWFLFISRYQALRELNQTERAFEKIWDALPVYEGTKLEDLIRRIFIEINPFDLAFTAAGRHWDRKGENEIDLIFLDEDSKSAHVVEVKRNLAKALKKEEKIKLYAKVSSIPQLKRHRIHYYFAGLTGGDIAIEADDGKRFVL